MHHRILKSDSKLEYASVPKSSVAYTFMPSAGIVYQHEAFQIGIFIGEDFIVGELGRNWKYQGKPGLGLAIGVSLFTKNNDQNSTGNNSPK